MLIAAMMGAAVYLLREDILRLYTHDSVIIGAALPLLAWVAVFHVVDAAQTVAAFVLRAYRVAATLDLVIAGIGMSAFLAWLLRRGHATGVAFKTAA